MHKRTLIALAAVALAFVVGAAVAVFLTSGRHSTRATMDPPGLLRQVQDLSELVTVKYSVQKVVGLKEDKSPFGSESILLVVQGTVLGGVDLKEMDLHDFRVEESRIFLKLPPARVLHVYLDDKNTRVWDRKITWWTPWVPYNPDFERKARLMAIDSIRGQAEEMGLLRDARHNAEQAIRTLLKAAGVVVEVTFVPT